MAAEKVQIKRDGWENAVTGIGTAVDRSTYTTFAAQPVLTPTQAMTLFHGEDIARTICSLVPQMALKRGVELVIENDSKRETAAQNRIAELEGLKNFTEACIFGRASGLGLMFCGIQDGKLPSEPFDPKANYKITSLAVFDARDIRIEAYDENLTSPTFGEPILYRIWPSGRKRRHTELVHASRCIALGGALTGCREKEVNGGIDHSVLQTCYQALKEFGTTWGSAASMMTAASQAVFKVEGLNDVLSRPDGQETLANRLRAINLGRSMVNAIVLDANGEDFQLVETGFQGVPEMLDRETNRISAAARIPQVLLFGESAKGLGNTGLADLKGFYDDVASYQRDTVTPALRQLYSLVLGEGGQEVPVFSFKWLPIDPTYDKTQAELRKLVADTDNIYLSQNVLVPEDVIASRFGTEGWSMETTVDTDERPVVTEKVEPLDVSPDPKPESKPLDVSSGTPQPAPQDGEPKAADTALNGAQVTSLLEVIGQVVAGQLPRETAVQIIVLAFNKTEEQANRLLGSVGQGFVPTSQPSAAPDAAPSSDNPLVVG